MEYGFECFISLFILILVLVLLHSIFIRYLGVLLSKIAVKCKEHFKPGQKQVTTEGNKLEAVQHLREDSDSELDEPDELEEVLISENEVDFELHRPVCTFYYSKYLHPGHDEVKTGDKEKGKVKDLRDDSESELAEVGEEATSENEADCECRSNGRLYYITLIQTPPKSFMDSL